MDTIYTYFSKTIGNFKHVESKGHDGISNYNLISENIYDIYKKTKNKHFIIKFLKSINKNSNQYKFIITNEKDWAKDYVNDNDIIAYVHIDNYQDDKFYIGGRIKSDSNYCCLSKIIKIN